MAEDEGSGSIFSQKLDRIAFTAYFLGAVTPLAALCVVVERYVFPTLSDRLATTGLIGLVASLAVLSLGSFLVLRRSTRRALERMDLDNARLAGLLGASSSLGSAQHESEAANTAVRCALEVSGAPCALLMLRSVRGGPVTLLRAAGDGAEKLFASHEERLVQVAELAVEGERPVLRGPDDTPDLGAVAAVPLRGERASAGALIAVHSDRRRSFDPGQVDSLATLAGLAAVSLRNTDLRDSQRNFFSHTTDMLCGALDSHLGYQTGHGGRVARLANRVGREIGLDDDALQRLHFAALLHDIGMLKFDRALQKDRKVCEKHPILGYKMLGRIRLWEDVAPIVLHHHEWFDGSGYPEGIAGADIPLESRIIAVCDAYDAITAEASYRIARSHEEAMHELRVGAGTQFDPDVVAVFETLAADGRLD